MKSWFTYTAAIVFAFATALLFSDYESAYNTFSIISTNLLKIGTLITIPLLLFSFSSAIASLRKDRMGGKCAKSIILWTVLTSIVLPLFAALVFYFFPLSFPVTSSAGSSGDVVGNYVDYLFNTLTHSITAENPFYTLVTTGVRIFPLFILSWIFGIFLNPSSDIIRPAYVVMNSFSEVVHKAARFYTVYGFIIAYFAFTTLFLSIYVEKTALAVPEYFLTLILITAALVFIILPMLFAIVTKFEKNPYSVFLLSISSLFLSLSSGSTSASIASNITTARLNLGVQKKHAVTSTFFYSIFAKGGSAAISVFLTLSLIKAMGGVLDKASIFLIALATIPSSFIAFSSTGIETVFISYLSLKMLNINLYGAESAIISIMMITNGLASFIDSYIASLGAKALSVKSGSNIEIPYEDYV